LVKIGGLPVQAQGTYDGERIPFRLDLILQRLAMDPLGSILTGAGSESFDEPLTTQQVVNIANLFIV
jgi:hypothetical protein